MQYGATEAFAQGMVDMVAAQSEGVYDAPRTPQLPALPAFAVGVKRRSNQLLQAEVLKQFERKDGPTVHHCP